MALRRRSVASLALVAASIGLLGCGSGSAERELEGEPFSDQERQDWTSNLAEIDSLATDGDCEGADSKLAALTTAVQETPPPERDAQLKADLITLLGDLDAQIEADCSEPAEPSSSTSSSTSSSSTTTEDEDTDPSSTTTSSSTTSTTSTQDDVEEPAEPKPVEPVEPVEPEPVEPETPGNSPVTPPGLGGVEPSEGGVSPRFESGGEGDG